MNYITINDTKYGFCRSSRASYTDKHNRAVKLATMFDYLSDKFDGMIERGQYISDNARLALACKLMMYTGIRIGNEDSAEGYMTKPHPKSKEEPKFVKTYGLTTMLREHVYVKGRKVVFMFLGKKHVDNTFEIGGELGGQVRKYLKCSDGDSFLNITDYQLKKFIKKSVGAGFTPKDFRTLRANMVAYETLEPHIGEQPSTKKELKGILRDIAVSVSEKLNNTPSVCKTSYIDPKFWDEATELINK